MFVEADQFRDDWATLGCTVEDLYRLQDEITAGPQQHPVIAGTGGLRKMRFAPRSSSKGQSGGVRVCYAFFEVTHTVLLVLAYAKNRQLDLTPAEKLGISKYLRHQEKAYSEGRVR